DYSLHKTRLILSDLQLMHEHRNHHMVILLLLLPTVDRLFFGKSWSTVKSDEHGKRVLQRKRNVHPDLLDEEPYDTDTDDFLILDSCTSSSLPRPCARHKNGHQQFNHHRVVHFIDPGIEDVRVKCECLTDC